MNENIDLTKILKNCPYRTKLYSIVHGEVEFMNIKENNIIVCTVSNDLYSFTSSGKLAWNYEDYSECILLPSKDQRDWSKFTAPWYKKEKFDPKTLNVFDKVLVKISNDDVWTADFFSHYDPLEEYMKYVCVTNMAVFCIPYNDETKHLVGTTEEAPEYYRYWEE